MTTVESIPHSSFPAKVAACRLRAIESQAVFTVMLNAISRPGSMHDLPHEVVSRMPAILAPVVTLADVETRVLIMDTDEFQWQEALCSATGARMAEIDAADLVAMTTESLHRLEEIFERIRVGTAFEPELGARMIVGVPNLGNHVDVTSNGILLRLSGPGIQAETEITIEGLVPSAVETWIRTNSKFPAGVDVWFVSDSGHTVGIPRSTEVSIAEIWSSHEEI